MIFFIIWTYSKDEFDQFIQTLNNFHPSVKLKATVSDNSVDFLDTTVFKEPMFRNTGILDTKIFLSPRTHISYFINLLFTLSTPLEGS